MSYFYNRLSEKFVRNIGSVLNIVYDLDAPWKKDADITVYWIYKGLNFTLNINQIWFLITDYCVWREERREEGGVIPALYYTLYTHFASIEFSGGHARLALPRASFFVALNFEISRGEILYSRSGVQRAVISK